MATANTYFEGIEQIKKEYDNRRTAHEAKKKEISEKYGWESEEMDAWYEEKEAMKFPVSEGENKAYWAWKFTQENRSSEFEVDDFLWDREVKDFVYALRKAGVKSIAFTNHSTALMENLHALAAEGCTIEGLCTVKRLRKDWEGMKEEEYPGIRIRIN